METLEVPEQNADTSTLLTRTNSGPDELSSKFRLNRRRIFRSERAEEAEVRLYEARRLKVIDGALDKLVVNDPSMLSIVNSYLKFIFLKLENRNYSDVNNVSCFPIGLLFRYIRNPKWSLKPTINSYLIDDIFEDLT